MLAIVEGREGDANVVSLRAGEARDAETPRQEVTEVTGRLIYRPELLRRVGVSYPTVWRWMRAGTLPARASSASAPPGSRTRWSAGSTSCPRGG